MMVYSLIIIIASDIDVEVFISYSLSNYWVTLSAYHRFCSQPANKHFEDIYNAHTSGATKKIDFLFRASNAAKARRK
jgi:hypothetical protein